MAYPLYILTMVRSSRAMKVTTVRLGVDLWGLLDREAAERRGEAKALRAESQQAARHARAVTAQSEQAIAVANARKAKAKSQE